MTEQIPVSPARYHEAFLATNGGKPITIEAVTFLPSGARISNSGYGTMYEEPPADKVECARHQVRYHRAWLKIYDAAIAQLQAIIRLPPGGALSAQPFVWQTDVLGPAPAERDRFGNADPKAALGRLEDLSIPHRYALIQLEAVLDPEGVRLKAAAETLARQIDASYQSSLRSSDAPHQRLSEEGQ
jgi:hypothetical protein